MKCPGQDTRFWGKDAIFEIECPDCGNKVEFFKDDIERRCERCGKRILNPRMDFGCASYCRYAEQCIGNIPAELIRQRKELLKDKVKMEVKRYFADDIKKMSHALKVASYAEKIGEKEGADRATVIIAAYLHELDPEIAKDILKKVGAGNEIIDEVCEMISNHPETLNFKVFFDADLIARIEEGRKNKEEIEKLFTETGKKLAKRILLEKS